MKIPFRFATVLVALAFPLAGPQTLEAASWLTNNSMGSIRWNHSTTLLPNGKVLFAGGYDGTGYYATSSASLYLPASKTFTNTGSMPFSSGHHTATLLPNGQVLVTGGYDIRPPSGTPRSNVTLYLPATGTWLATNALNSRRAEHTATLLPNGKVLVVGGLSFGSYPVSTELFDPATGTWALSGSLANGRRAHTATLLTNGNVLVAGGYNGSSTLSSAELYHPDTQTWTPVGGMLSARYNHTATLLPNGKVLVAGGFVSGLASATAELFDPATGLWTSTGAMATQRTLHRAALLAEGRVLVMAGQGSGGILSSTELYNPASGTWSSGGVMSTNRCNHTAMLLADGEVLVAGGNDALAHYFSSTELFVPDGLSPVAIILNPAAPLASGGFRFTFTNIPIPGATFTVYSTTNPALPTADWSLLGGASDLLPGKFEFADPDSTNLPVRFYRVRAP